MGDSVLLRADGLFAYRLAVVDDAEAGVTEVVRPICRTLTARQILLQRLLGHPRRRRPLVGGREQQQETSSRPWPARSAGGDPAQVLVDALDLLGQQPSGRAVADAGLAAVLRPAALVDGPGVPGRRAAPAPRHGEARALRGARCRPSCAARPWKLLHVLTGPPLHLVSLLASAWATRIRNRRCRSAGTLDAGKLYGTAVFPGCGSSPWRPPAARRAPRGRWYDVLQANGRSLRDLPGGAVSRGARRPEPGLLRPRARSRLSGTWKASNLAAARP